MDFSEILKSIPQVPGVYMMKDSLGNVIYVGKAKKLRNRVSQYFHSQKDRSPKIIDMIRNIDSIEYIVVDTELDAFLEEMRLIREHKPRYNRQMKNEKNYTYIKLPEEAFPRFTAVAEKADDSALYFGPFTIPHRVEYTLKFLEEFYPVRKCATPHLVSRSGGCLFYQLGSCLGVCTGKVGSPEYRVEQSSEEIFIISVF